MSRFTFLGFLILFALLVFLRDTPLGLADFPSQECNAFKSWITTKTQNAPELERILPPPESRNLYFENPNPWAGVAKNILGWAGWPSKHMHFASFRSYTFNHLITEPHLQSGAFLIVIPGPPDTKLKRRKDAEPWITASPASLADALPLKALETLALALESRVGRLELKNEDIFTGKYNSTGNGGGEYISNESNLTMKARKLHGFHIEVAPSPYSFPLCRGRGGACAVWEGSTGRIILDADVARRIISSSTIATLLDKFTLVFANILGGSDGDSTISIEEKHIMSAKINNISTGDAFREEESHSFHSTSAAAEAPVAAAIGAWIAKAATAAITSLLVASTTTTAGIGGEIGRQPLWWCLTCPIVLGLLAPMIINFGLTAAAEQLCATLQLPAEECSDLWWAAFALAMVLSLGSAVPIVYVCRLPDCIKHALDRN